VTEDQVTIYNKQDLPNNYRSTCVGTLNVLTCLAADEDNSRLVKPAYISVIGTFQDGGLKHNNPVNLALWECLHIWPSVVKPDLLVSLGTGTDREIQSPSASHFDIFSRMASFPDCTGHSCLPWTVKMYGETL
jgi:hypothetical protein